MVASLILNGKKSVRTWTKSAIKFRSLLGVINTIRFNEDIDEVLKRTIKRLEEASEKEHKQITKNFARKLIRTFYSMVMARSQIWTTRLHQQAEVVSHQFPEKSSTIHTLLQWVDEPGSDREAVYQLFKREGEWASANFLNEAKIKG